MMIHGQVPYGWDQLNAKVRNHLGVNALVQTFKSTSHALFDISIGLHLKFSHKRKVIVDLGQGSHLHNLQIEMAKMGVRFKNEFVADDSGSLDKDIKATLAYITDSDDALSGAKYDRSGVLSSLEDKNIFRIQIFHHGLGLEESVLQDIRPYDIRVLALESGVALAVMGEKCLLPALSSNTMFWSDQDGKDICQALDSQRPQDQEAVVAFEKALPKEARPWFSETEEGRYFDRSVVIFDEVDGAAFTELFCEQNGYPKGRPGLPCVVETTSYTQWKNKIWLDQAPSYDRSAEDLRGMVSFRLDIIDGELPAKISRVLDALTELSG